MDFVPRAPPPDLAPESIMKKHKILLSALAVLALSASLSAQSLNFPSRRWGISFGNSKEFTGLRFNYRDYDVVRVTGLNFTLWVPYDMDENNSLIEGLSFGLIPGGGTLHGIQAGILGVAGIKEVWGLSFGILGVGTGGSMTGINVGGIGAGAGKDMIGVNIGGLGMGAGRDVIGLNIGGIGMGAGRNLYGINIALLGLGAGERACGINIAGLGLGAGDLLSGLTVAGIGAGSTEVRGIAIACGAVGGETIRGITVSGIGNLVVDDGRMTGIAIGGIGNLVADYGRMTGVAAGSVNWIKGTMTGLSIGIVNYAWSLKGVQVGLVNIVRDNPSWRRVLPFVNWGF